MSADGAVGGEKSPVEVLFVTHRTDMESHCVVDRVGGGGGR